MSGSKPIVATETGYCTLADTASAVSPAIAARYLPRVFLEQFRQGVARTYWYELVDEGAAGCDSNYGLLTATAQPKPAFGALRQLVAALQDAPALPAGTRLGATISSSDPALHSLLLGKHDGSYLLALWLEESGWDVRAGTGRPLAETAADVTVQLTADPASASAGTLTDAGTLQAVATAWSGGATHLRVTGNVTLLSFRP
ncbi:MAG TPA: hypothetical protein VF457_04665 [Burkholderiaceae bacterium]